MPDSKSAQRLQLALAAAAALGVGLGVVVTMFLCNAPTSRRRAAWGLLRRPKQGPGAEAVHRGATRADVSTVLRQAVRQGLLGRRPAGGGGGEHKWAVFYDLDAFHATLAALRAAFPPHFMHAMAVKSNPEASMLGAAVSEHGMGLECASFQEVEHSLRAGCPAARVVYDSPCKTHADIRAALRLGVVLNCDNLHELERVVEARAELGGSQSTVGVRVNPLLGGGSIEALSVSTADSKFGVPLTPQNRVKVIAAFMRHPWLSALHVHVGSQGIGLDMLAAGARVVAQLADEIDLAAGGRQVTTLDIGGGMPSNFAADTMTPTFTEYARVLRAAVPSLFEEGVGGRSPRRVITEYGRAILAKSGWTVSEVEYVKATPSGKQVAIIHAGSDMFLRSCYCHDDFPVRLAVFDADGGPASADAVLCDVAGPLCFGGDRLGRNVSLPTMQEGDFVAVLDTGANCLSMWSRHCSRPSPAVYGYSCSRRGVPGGPGPAIQLLRHAETTDRVLSFWE